MWSDWAGLGSTGLGSVSGRRPWDAVKTPLRSLPLHNARITASEARHPRFFAPVGKMDRSAIMASIMDSAAWHSSVGRICTFREATFVKMRSF